MNECAPPISTVSELALETRGLSKTYGALVACNGVSLTLRSGEIHALIGPNGAGKSTFIKLVTGEERADAGTVTIAGRNANHLDAVGRARLGLARSFQISAIAAGFSVLENVVLAVQGASGVTYRFVRAALADPALTDPAHRHLERVGLERRASTLAGDLSHGERRRLELAMALAMEPIAFLLDEPMAGLGAEGARDLTSLLADLRREAPILLVEHDMDAVFALADRISVLVSGEIIATGSVEEIRSSAAVRHAYLGDET